ncbi:hypothetical protein FCV25MIE_08877 [Fagus crenata]
MGDECVEMLANKVANLASSVSSQQQTLKELQEMIAALHARLDHIAGLYARYGPMEFDDNFGDLTKLKQIGIVREYEGYFERLLSRWLRVGRLPPSQQVGCFISGLKDHLRVNVQALKPTSLSSAVGLARLYGAKCHSQLIQRRKKGLLN